VSCVDTCAGESLKGADKSLLRELEASARMVKTLEDLRSVLDELATMKDLYASPDMESHVLRAQVNQDRDLCNHIHLEHLRSNVEKEAEFQALRAEVKGTDLLLQAKDAELENKDTQRCHHSSLHHDPDLLCVRCHGYQQQNKLGVQRVERQQAESMAGIQETAVYARQCIRETAVQSAKAQLHVVETDLMLRQRSSETSGFESQTLSIQSPHALTEAGDEGYTYTVVVSASSRQGTPCMPTITNRAPTPQPLEADNTTTSPCPHRQ